MNRKPIFDAVRAMLQRGFRRAEIDALDRACDLAEGIVRPSAEELGWLSEEYESGGRGPGTVSGGRHDAGGVFYGVYQLASKTGTCAAFVKAEGARWAHRFGSRQPGTAAFSAVWKEIAREEPDAFRAAQHAFIERTHYRPAVAAVLAGTGLDLDARSKAVRDVTWSCAVQHGGAARILSDAVARADRDGDRADRAYDRTLVEAIYDRRTAYVLGVANHAKLPGGTRKQLVAITDRRYPAERARALAMLEAALGFEIKSMDALRGRFALVSSADESGWLAARSKHAFAAFGDRAIGERL